MTATVPNEVASATLQQFNAAVKKIENRESQIADLKKQISETQPQATLNADARKQVKDLEDLNQRDREFVKTSIEFYEDITGDSVGTGDLFNQNNEDASESARRV